MPEHVIIDGNNLLHAMHAHAPIPNVGRETLVKVVERWARTGDDQVTLVFDGPVPRQGLAAQMSSPRMAVRFSAPQTADDVIVAEIHQAAKPSHIRIVSSDTAIRREARHRRCRHTDAATFVAELFSSQRNQSADSVQEKPTREKPQTPSAKQTETWMELFGYNDNDIEPFDGADAMNQ